MKALYIDVETTGRSAIKNAIHSISGIVEIDGKVMEEFDINVKPFDGAEIEDGALEVSHVTKDEIMQYPSIEIGFKQFTDILAKHVNKYNKVDKFHFIGYNAQFDNQFVREFFTHNKDNFFGSWFWNGTIDILSLAAEALKNDRASMENFKLITVAKKLGIPIDEKNFHKSLYDIQITREIHQVIIHRSTGKTLPSSVYLLLDNRSSVVGCFYNEIDALELQKNMVNSNIKIQKIK